MAVKDKKMCAICGDKAGIFTRIKLNDGLLCGDCVKKCSEHLDAFDQKTATEIYKHLLYRGRNYSSEMFRKFTPTLILGDYEMLMIDQKNNFWTVKTAKRLYEKNPDIFYLSQVTGCKVIEKKELVTLPLAEEEKSTPKKTEKLKNKLLTNTNKGPDYGSWFYLRIEVHHPFFSDIVMRVNKYIILHKNREDYMACKKKADDICSTFFDLCKNAIAEDTREKKL